MKMKRPHLSPATEQSNTVTEKAFSLQQTQVNNNHNFTALSLTIRPINNYKTFA